MKALAKLRVPLSLDSNQDPSGSTTGLGNKVFLSITVPVLALLASGGAGDLPGKRMSLLGGGCLRGGGGALNTCFLLGGQLLFIVFAEGLIGFPLRFLFISPNAFGLIEGEPGLSPLLGAECSPAGHSFVEGGLLFAGQFFEIVGHGQPFIFLARAERGPVGCQGCQGFSVWLCKLPPSSVGLSRAVL